MAGGAVQETFQVYLGETFNVVAAHEAMPASRNGSDPQFTNLINHLKKMIAIGKQLEDAPLFALRGKTLPTLQEEFDKEKRALGLYSIPDVTTDNLLAICEKLYPIFKRFGERYYRSKSDIMQAALETSLKASG